MKKSLFFNGVEIARITGENLLTAELLIESGEALKKVNLKNMKEFLSNRAYAFIRSQNDEVIKEFNEFCDYMMKII